MTLKWKLYRVSNYFLLLSGTLLFLKFLDLGIRSGRLEFEFYTYSICLLFLLIISLGLVNIIVMAKTFPDKLLIGGKSYWHLFAIMCNVLSSFAMFYIIAFLLLPETANIEEQGDMSLIVVLCGFLFLFINLIFVLFCQLEFKRFLKRNYSNLVDSMINSIGKE